jgi:D-alanyl-D-alanine carboxypeptidase/D-alanyl-D-alanine-endopeptidase (penicillin-binding protein 4)
VLVVAAWLGVAPVVSVVWGQSEIRGVLAVRGDLTLAQENADRLFLPASVQKLVVAAAALHHLGPNYRIVTELRADGVLHDDGTGVRLEGDLVLVGAGDPTWNRRHRGRDSHGALRDLVAVVRKQGIQEVTGDIVLDVSAFPGRRVPLDWSVGDTSFSYGAGPTAMALDENVLGVTARAGRLWQPALLTVEGGYDWQNLSVTVPSHRHGRGTLDFQPIWGTRTIVVRGEFPITEPVFGVRLAVPDGVERVGRELVRLLQEAGVQFDGEVIVAREKVPASRLLGATESPPLREIVEVILEDSNNWYAEMLLRRLAIELSGEGRIDHGLGIAADFLIDVVGVAPKSFEFDDAAGLSPFNLLSPRSVVELLRWCWRQKWADDYFAAMPGVGEGTLGSWGAVPPVVAKTGTLRQTQSLAGVLGPGSKDPVFFVVFVNHSLATPGEMKRDIRQLLWRWYRWPDGDSADASLGETK